MSQPTDEAAELTQREVQLDGREWTLALEEVRLRGQALLVAQRGVVLSQRAQWLDQRARHAVNSGAPMLTDADPDGWVAEAHHLGARRRQLVEDREVWLQRRQEQLAQLQATLAAIDAGLSRVESRLGQREQQAGESVQTLLAGGWAAGPQAGTSVEDVATQRPVSGSQVVVPAVPTRAPSRTELPNPSPPLQARPVSKRLTERPQFRPAAVRAADDDMLAAAPAARATDTSIQPRTRVVVDVLSDVVDPRHAPTIGLPGAAAPAARSEGAAGAGHAARHAPTDPVLATVMLADVPIAAGQIEVDRVTRTLLVTLADPPKSWPAEVVLVGQRPDGQRYQWPVEVRRTLPAPPRGTLIILAPKQMTAADLQTLQGLVDQLG